MARAVTAKVERPPELFFAFPDGVYDYACAECTALCCKTEPGLCINCELDSSKKEFKIKIA